MTHGESSRTANRIIERAVAEVIQRLAEVHRPWHYTEIEQATWDTVSELTGETDLLTMAATRKAVFQVTSVLRRTTLIDPHPRRAILTRQEPT